MNRLNATHTSAWFLIISMIISALIFSYPAGADNSPNKTIPLNESPQSDLPFLHGMNLSVLPGDDFYLYANGQDIMDHPIPSDMGKYTAKEQLEERVTGQVKEIIEEYASETGYSPDSSGWKIGEYYRQGMDVEKINRQGIDPIMPLMDEIDAASSNRDVLNVSTRMMTLGIPSLFRYYADGDPNNTSEYVATITQDGLGLPGRGYYLNISSFVPIQQAYHDHIMRTFELSGYSETEAGSAADTVMRIETILANASYTGVEGRDQNKTRSMMTIDELSLLAPEVNWHDTFLITNTSDIQAVHVMTPPYFRTVSDLLSETPLQEWKIYLKWKLLAFSSPYLSDPFADESFRFYGTFLSGTNESTPRWKKVVQKENEQIGWLIAPDYLDRHFSSSDKQRIERLTEQIRRAFHARIDNLTWMSPETKKKAHTKLDRMEIFIGYPDNMPDYSPVDIRNDSYVENVLRSGEYIFQYGYSGVSKIGTSVEDQNWKMTPQTPNAYNKLDRNEIVFPAGILQPPEYYPDGDDIMNFGAIGFTIGHEMTHGFDDQGRMYDPDGTFNNWWTDEDISKFNELAKKIAVNYGMIEVLPGLHLNGNFTLGENIADLGGISLAYDACEDEIPELMKNSSDGFSGSKEFFLSFARLWSGSVRDEELRNWVMNNDHSPNNIRVNETVYNTDKFYDAFPEITLSDSGYIPRENRIGIW